MGCGTELTFAEGKSDKFWRAFWVHRTVITHYGRRGSLGQLTVHQHFASDAARARWNTLALSKGNSGYRESWTFAHQIPRGIADQAASTNSTGQGGTSSAYGWVIVACFAGEALRRGLPLTTRDPISEAMAAGTLTDSQVVAGILAGLPVSVPALRDADPDEVGVLAGLIALGGGLPTPAQLVGAV